MLDNNKVTISGEIAREFEYNHEVYGEKFYTSTLEVRRESGYVDKVPIEVSDRLVSVNDTWTGNFVRIKGEFRSYNQHGEGKSRLILFVFARDIEVLDGRIDSNEIILNGFICKEPTYRKTPLGREISEILIAANRAYGKSDYIPCIAWGRNARFTSGLEIGKEIKICGRIQSREYLKRYKDGIEETRTEYEVSVCRIYLLEDDANENSN